MIISYAITVYNELTEIQNLLSLLITNKRDKDEIVVLFDDKGPQEVWNYLLSLEDKIVLNRAQFKNNFATWKNILGEFCSGKFIFQIDADEIPSVNLIQMLPEIIENNSEIDLFLVSRINTVQGIGLSHIKYKWGWNVSKFDSMIEEKEFDLNNPQDLDEYNLLKEYNLIIEEGFKKIKYYKPIINWCDYQTRIYRNSPDIKWVGNVHERINGTKTLSLLPAEELWGLYHPKTIERQEKQNNYYNEL